MKQALPSLLNWVEKIYKFLILIIMTNTAIAEPPVNKILNDRPLAEIDPAIHAVLEDEKQRQSTHIELIASENFTLPAIIETTGSVLTNKYAEGYPAKRYYGGCEHVDVAESLAIERAKICLVQSMQMYNRTQAVSKYSGIFRDASTG